MYKITHKQKLNLRKIERWSATEIGVEWNDWYVLSSFLGWIRDNNSANVVYDADHDCKLCIHTSYNDKQRVVFNSVRKAYLNRYV